MWLVTKIVPKTIFPFLLITLFLHLSPVYASEVVDKVKSTIDRVLDILKDKSLQGGDKTKERRTKIRNIVKERFDFEEMAKRALGVHWRERTDVERREFVALFSDFLERAYIDKIESYSDEEIIYTGEIKIDDKAEVKTRVITRQGTEIPLNYRLLKTRNDWMVYDVVIEGVSLVSNYRSQFNEIIKGFSYEELIKRLKSKVEEKGS